MTVQHLLLSAVALIGLPCLVIGLLAMVLGSRADRRNGGRFILVGALMIGAALLAGRVLQWAW